MSCIFVEELTVAVLFVNTVPYILTLSLVSSNIGGFTRKATTGVSLSTGQLNTADIN